MNANKESGLSPYEEPANPVAAPFLIGLFDVLGFKEWLKDAGLTQIQESYQNLIAKAVLKDSYRCLGLAELELQKYYTAVFSLPVGHAYFSDTILLWVPLTQLFVSPFLARCADLICESLVMRIPLRGAVAIGQAVMHGASSTYLGDPVVEAHKLEHAQDWIGASLGSSTTWPEFQRAMNPPREIILYDPPLKPTTDRDLISGMVLDWPRRWREKHSGDLRSLIAELDRKPEFSRYYQNAIQFASYSASNSDWYERLQESQKDGVGRMCET